MLIHFLDWYHNSAVPSKQTFLWYASFNLSLHIPILLDLSFTFDSSDGSGSTAMN